MDHGLQATLHDNKGILALQGPSSQKVLGGLVPGVAVMRFLDFGRFVWKNHELLISRSGYTGEDGFESICEREIIEDLANALMADPDVDLAGLGARDTLRLEAGLCLYGQDLTEDISPIEADLLWAIGARRRVEGGYLGAEVLTEAVKKGPAKKRVGLRLEGQLPARAGAVIVSLDGEELGVVSSGGYSPTLESPIAMGYVRDQSDRRLKIRVRDKEILAQIVDLPFVPHRYKK